MHSERVMDGCNTIIIVIDVLNPHPHPPLHSSFWGTNCKEHWSLVGMLNENNPRSKEFDSNTR